ncbi:protein decapping 5-like [Argentina anserina]|uniref:protein decapping 5-like n=1 Tax=Argentina anserina TaxID=57926 RepID=UPI00217651A4|nr:protein decapping 5-like [Potentilla anserina]
MAAALVEAQPPKSSSNGHADSYIGSLISLTSKSEIRYEGVLFNINTQESSIGLRNVRSFGTEGRKMDGPQIPPSDKVYDYILFRGSDIKDLQVKSSPPVQTNTNVHDDPAIIRTHYSQAVTVSTNLPSSGIASIPDVKAQTPQMGLPKPTFQSTLPVYQPLGSLGSWGASAPPVTNGSGMPMTMYWQGFSGPSDGFQHQQQSLLMPSPGLSMPPSMQQPMSYPTINTSLSDGSSDASISKPSEPPSTLFPTLGRGTPSLNSHMLPAQSPALTMGIPGDLQSSAFPSKSSATVSEPSSSLILNKALPQTRHTAASSTSLPLVSPLTPALDKTNILLPALDEPKIGPTAVTPVISESVWSTANTPGSVLADGAMPPLVTPGQFFQPDLTMVSSSQPSQTAQTDVEVVKVLSSELPPSPPATAKASQEPILPLPAPSIPKLHGTHAIGHQSYRGSRERGGHGFTHQSYRGGRERGGHAFNHQNYRGRGRGGHAFNHHDNRGSESGRGSRISRPVTKFTEDFNFTAMNEKFNKDEVWGDLGKSNKVLEDVGESQDEKDVGASPYDDPKNVYVKDDFFDSLSCDALNRGSHNERIKFSEKVRKDTETFGYSPRHRGGRGSRLNGRGGRWKGSYNGSGYGYAGQGRGHNFPNRATY